MIFAAHVRLTYFFQIAILEGILHEQESFFLQDLVWQFKFL